MSSFADRVKQATEINSLERVFRTEDIHRIVGVDEVGIGALAGPLVAAACCFTLPMGTFSWEKKIRDSKRLSEDSREWLYPKICKNATYAVGESSPRDVEDLGTNRANDKAMLLAIEAVLERVEDPDLILIDGKRVPKGLDNIPRSCRVMALPRADHRSMHVGAASIIAKVTRDRYMRQMHEKWPDYAFCNNKGYGTGEHRAAIEASGPCEIHRRTFGCVREYLANSPE